jgi:hypothetical protein
MEMESLTKGKAHHIFETLNSKEFPFNVMNIEMF